MINRQYKSYRLGGQVLQHGFDYPTPGSISYFWGGGALAIICLVIQIVSGLFLGMHYAPHTMHAFNSVEHIMRDVNYGWLFRYSHANGASVLFLVLYFHMARGMYYISYNHPKARVWVSGIVMFLLTMGTAFLGYVLPWGQMSFWGATVITNLATAIPYVGSEIALWLWGGFSIENATLNRFYVLHWGLALLIIVISVLHIASLHIEGSTAPSGFFRRDFLGFFPYFVQKDFFNYCVFFGCFTALVCFKPNLLGHTDNYIRADPLSTPPHIVPEWYFLPFYAMLRSVPDKLGGVLCMGLSIAALFILPILINPKFKTSLCKPVYTTLFWFFVTDVLILGWLGSQVVEQPYIIIGQIATVFYFLLLVFLMPLSIYLEDLNIRDEILKDFEKQKQDLKAKGIKNPTVEDIIK